MNKFGIVILASVVSIPAYSFEFSAPTSYELNYTHSIGNIDGFVQIPKGGQFGTTSEKRPEFKELDIQRIHYPELTLKAKWSRLSISLDGKYEEFKGKGKLTKDLISHDVVIPKDSFISTKHRYAFYGLKTGYDFAVTPKWTITPELGIHVFDFSYRFSAKNSNNGNIANNDTRSFHASMTTLGINSNYSFHDDWNLRVSATTNIPYGNIRHYFDASMSLAYNLYRNNNQELNILAGIGYESFYFKDSQKDMQNFMKHHISPVYKIGLEYKF